MGYSSPSGFTIELDLIQKAIHIILGQFKEKGGIIDELNVDQV